MMGAISLILLVVLSAVAVTASMHAWRARQAYGFHRFMAFESIVLLIAWNADRWFRDPLSGLQIASWTLLTLATGLAVHAAFLLITAGKARRRIIEDTQFVVETGAYRYIRHPAYAALMIFGWGVCFKGADWPSVALAVASTAFLVATSRCEEAFNIERLGAAYREYMDRTKMFIPFLL
jgi:protein-S-isoprenylcysteine O-methyltransferase Ste14